MNAPESFRAGDSVSWTESFPEYPAADGWALALRLLWPTGTPADIPAAADGNDFAISLSATATASWAAGAATLIAAVSKGDERITVYQSPVKILANLATATALDNRSQARKGLEDARAALADYAGAGKIHVAEYDVAGRKMKFRDSGQIIDLIHYYEREVAKENAALAILQGQTPGRVVVRM